MHMPTSAPPRRRRSHTVVVLFFTSPCEARAPLRPGAAERASPHACWARARALACSALPLSVSPLWLSFQSP